MYCGILSYVIIMEFASNPALCYKSKLIALLPVHITLSELLTNLDIYESPDDVVALIVAANNAQEELLRKIVCKIGIVRALYICDELCAPTVVSDIISLNIKLDRVLDFSIINHHTRFSKIAHYTCFV